METSELVAGFAALGTSTIGNALDELRTGGLMLNLRPLVPGRPFCGPAMTAQESVGAYGSRKPADFSVGAILDATAEGEVVVIANAGAPVSTMGGLAALAAARKGIAGAVIDGGARDLEEVTACGFSIYARHLVPSGGRGRIKVEAVGVPVAVDGVVVHPGDIIVADGTGIACVPLAAAPDVLALARRFAENDREARRLIEEGTSLAQAMRRFDTI